MTKTQLNLKMCLNFCGFPCLLLGVSYNIMNYSRIDKLITRYEERYSGNYFKLEWIKKKLRLLFRDYSCFFTRKISWKFRLLGWAKYVWNFLGPLGGDLTFLGPDFVVGKIIFDFSWSAFCWIWIFSCLHLSNDFFLFFAFFEKITEVTKIMPD